MPSFYHIHFQVSGSYRAFYRKTRNSKEVLFSHTGSSLPYKVVNFIFEMLLLKIMEIVVTLTTIYGLFTDGPGIVLTAA